MQRRSPGLSLDPLLPREHDPLGRLVHAAWEAAAHAKHAGERTRALLGAHSLTGRHYDGRLGGASDGPACHLFYFGRPPYAREFELYFRADKEHAVSANGEPLLANVATARLRRDRLLREASDASLSAIEIFPGAPRPEGAIVHYPALEAFLPVERSVTQQIRRVVSRARRRLMRSAFEERRTRSWIETSPRAFDRFLAELHGPYARTHFGVWRTLDDDDALRARFARQGRVLFVAERERPLEPVAGAVLFDEHGGGLGYAMNGFATPEACTGDLLTERAVALELAVIEHAIERRSERIGFGYVRAILNDGLFTHKRQLGCTFVPLSGSAPFRLAVRPEWRAPLFARFPLLAGRPGQYAAILGYDVRAPRRPKRAWRGILKGFRLPGLMHAVVFSNAMVPDDLDAERQFREAAREALELPEGLQFVTCP